MKKRRCLHHLRFDRNLTATECLSLSLQESYNLVEALFCFPLSLHVCLGP
jgi:hypothetical protein